jgi:hypothetical protein
MARNHLQQQQQQSYYNLSQWLNSIGLPWLSRLSVGISSRATGFDPRPVHVELVINTLALIQVSPRVSQYHRTTAA